MNKIGVRERYTSLPFQEWCQFDLSSSFRLVANPIEWEEEDFYGLMNVSQLDIKEISSIEKYFSYMNIDKYSQSWCWTNCWNTDF